MEKKRWVLILMTLCLALALTNSLVEAAPRAKDENTVRKCNDGKDNDLDDLTDGDDPDCDGLVTEPPPVGNGDGNENEPAEIVFMGDTDIDDDGNAYRDERIGGGMGVGVAIGSRAARGVIFLNTLESPTRRLSMNFVIGICLTIDGSVCEPLGIFAGRNHLPARIVVDVNDVLKNGVYDIAEGTPPIPVMAPMRVQFHEDMPNVPFEDNLFLHFDPGQKNCEGSQLVAVTNEGGDTWRVQGPAIGCLVHAPGPHPEPVGYYPMSFDFTVMIDPG